MKPQIKKTDETKEYFHEEGCFILELSNSPDDPGLSIARARVEAGHKTKLHRLDGIAEQYVILSGKGHVEVGDLPAREVTCGDVVIIPPGCAQRVENMGNDDLIFLAICTPRFTAEAYVEIQNSMA